MSIQDVLDRLLKMEGKLDKNTVDLQSITTVVADISKQNSENLAAMDEMEERMSNNMEEVNKKIEDVQRANKDIVERVVELEDIANTELQRNENIVTKLLDDKLKEKLAEFKSDINLRIQTELSQIQPISQESSQAPSNLSKENSNVSADSGLHTSGWAASLFGKHPEGRSVSVSNEPENRRMSLGAELEEIGESIGNVVTEKEERNLEEKRKLIMDDARHRIGLFPVHNYHNYPSGGL